MEFKCDLCGKEYEEKMALVGHMAGAHKYKKEEEPKAEVTKERKKRIPFGAPQKHWGDNVDPKKVRRVFNAEWHHDPSRIQRALDAGYVFVNEERNMSSVGSNEDGSPIKGVLMEIDKELYQEDQKAKQREIDKVDEQIHRGKYQEKPEDKRYLPGDGVKIETKLRP